LGVPLKVICKADSGAAPAPSARGKSGSAVRDENPTVVVEAQVENDDPDMLFQYANERIPE
jgi:hypothetical protein